MALTAERIPHDLEAEEMLVASVMVDADLVPVAMDAVADRDFFDARLGRLFGVVRGMWLAGEEVNQISVAYALAAKYSPSGQQTQLEELGGQAWIADRIRALPFATPDTVQFYAAIVRRTALQRGLLQIAAKLTTEVYFHDPDPVELAAKYAGELLSRDDYGAMDSKPIREVMQHEEVAQEIVEWMADMTKIPGVSTGFPQLDAFLGGLVPGRVIVVSAKPGIGKSLFVQNVAEAVAQAGETLLVFTTEMSRGEFAKRIMFLGAGVDPVEARLADDLTDDQKRRLHASIEATAALPIILNGRGALTLDQVRAEIRRFNISHGVKIVILDHYDMVSAEGKNRYEELRKITAELKNLAADIGVCIVVVSHMNRDAGRDGKSLHNEALRDSSTKEADANQILLLEPVHPKSAKDAMGNVTTTWVNIDKQQAGQNIRTMGYVYVRLIVSKNRHGAEGTIMLKIQWRDGGGRFVPVSNRAERSE